MVLLHTLGLASFLLLVVVEMAIPYWAERPQLTRWHPNHIAKRYGLFTIIVLGEGISQIGTAGQAAFTAGGASPRLLLFALWWLYFLRESGDALRERPNLAFFWGYSHYLIFAAVAAVAAGIDVAVTALDAPKTRRVGAAGVHVELSRLGIAVAIAAPVAVYLVALAVMSQRLHDDVIPAWPGALGAAAVTVAVAIAFSGLPLPLVTVLIVVPTVALVLGHIVLADRRARAGIG